MRASGGNVSRLLPGWEFMSMRGRWNNGMEKLLELLEKREMSLVAIEVVFD